MGYIKKGSGRAYLAAYKDYSSSTKSLNSLAAALATT